MFTIRHPASCLSLLAALALAGPAAAQQQLFTFNGLDQEDYLGCDVSPAGDVNADGTPDIIVGAFTAGAGLARTGAAYVLSGKGGAVLRSWSGAADFDSFGGAVAGVGDVNKDGFADVVVGAALADNNGAESGRVVVYSGKTGGILFDLSNAPTAAYLGASVTGLGDVNGDTFPDFAASAPQFAMVAGIKLGRVYVYSGANGSVLATVTGTHPMNFNASFGNDIADAGDVNGDNVHDLIIGEPYVLEGGSKGRIEVHSGANFATSLYTVLGAGIDETLGSAVDGAGDVNGDGFADVIAGGYFMNGHTGDARIFLGPSGTPGWVFNGDAPQDHFGGAVAGVGDIDKDGHDDVMVGAAQGEDPNPLHGYARIYSGRTGQQIYATLNGEAGGDVFGVSLCGVGDVTGDGWADIAIGAQASNANGEDSGKLYVYEVLTHATNLGFGGPGTAQLSMYGSPLDDFGQMDLALSGAKANAPAWLVASAGTSFLAFKGGVIVPNVATGVVIPLTTNGSGKITIPGILGGFGPVSIAIQYVIKDAAKPLGFAMSNAVSANFLP